MVRITGDGTQIVATMRGHIATELATIMADMDDQDTLNVAAASEAIAGKNLN